MVYLVDDDIILLKLLNKSLKKEFPNLQFKTFNNPLDAIRRINEPNSLCIFDYEMEPLNGVELIRELNSKNGNLKYILMSSLGKTEIEQYKEKNIIDYQSKDEKLVHILKVKINDFLNTQVAS